jgi:branched-chain amino acid transport system ATP-binding protein
MLEVRGLTCRFGGLVAVDDVSLSVERGSVHSIIGPNGAGKTTLFNCISGAYRPQAGSVRLEGTELIGRRPDRIAALGVARTFQNLELFGNATTLENLMLGRHLHMRTGLWHGATMLWRGSFAAREEAAHRHHVETLIEMLELEGVRDLPAAMLPYGVRKRVELGRALALEPQLLLLDEPAAGMTAEERGDLVHWIGDIRGAFGITILMVEHDMGMVMSVSDRLTVLNFGRCIADGTPQQVAAHPEVVAAYLGEEAARAAV